MIIQAGHESNRIALSEQENNGSQFGNRTLELAPSKQSVSICQMSDTESQITVSRFEQSTLRNYMLGAPAVDDLLTLIPFNMYRALISNAQVLGYKLDEINHDSAVSRFYSTTLKSDWQCPASLCPTKIQHLVPHHPWLDLFPIPRMRDNLILAGSSLDETELCTQLVGFSSGRTVRPGIAIWGEAWNPLCWEVTEAFVQNWKWVLEGCEELLISSDKWRAQRGEKPMTF